MSKIVWPVNEQGCIDVAVENLNALFNAERVKVDVLPFPFVGWSRLSDLENPDHFVFCIWTLSQEKRFMDAGWGWDEFSGPLEAGHILASGSCSLCGGEVRTGLVRPSFKKEPVCYSCALDADFMIVTNYGPGFAGPKIQHPSALAEQ